MGSTTVSAGGRAAGGSTRRRQGRQVPQEAALSGSFPPVAGSRTGSADGPRRPGQLWGADCELEQKNSFLRRCLTPHPLPQPLHLIPPSQPLGCRQYDCRQDRGGKGRKEPPAQPNCGKKKKKGKKFLLLRPIPSTDTESQPPNRQSCNSSQDCGVREGCRVWSTAVVGDPGARAPQNGSPKAQSFRQQYLRAPPGSPSAGAARLAVFLPQAASSSAHACSPSLLPELGSRRRSLGEKNVSARTIPFSPPPLAQPGSLLLSRAPARAAPLAPRVSFSAAPASALSSHYSRVARGQEVIRDRPVAASTRKARCRRGAGGGARTRARGGARDKGA